MEYIKNVLALLLLLALGACSNSTKTEKYQKERDVIANVHSLLIEIKTDPILIGSIARPCVLGNHVIIADYNSPDRLIHLFRKDNFKYLGSTAYAGQGPGEITSMGHIGTDENRHKFYVSDHGKQKIFSYDIDSVLSFPNYMPTVKIEMNTVQFPSKYQYVNDTLSFALAIEPTSTSTFKQYIAKWNMQSGQFARMKYQHPDITKKRICFAVSIENDIYVECYTFHDLMSICNLNGDLICNIYGPSWDSRESNRVHHYGDVIFCKDKILASYSGGANFSDEYNPTKILVFDLHGDYLKTLDIGYKIVDFCYDGDNNRIIMNLNDEIQFAYLNLEGLI